MCYGRDVADIKPWEYGQIKLYIFLVQVLKSAPDKFTALPMKKKTSAVIQEVIKK